MDRVASCNCGSATGIRFLLMTGQPDQEVRAIQRAVRERAPSSWIHWCGTGS